MKVLMSYIRSGSNPEHLYIWGDGDGNVHFIKGPYTIGTMPTKIFNELIYKCSLDNDDDVIEINGAKIQNVWVDSDDTLCDGKPKEGLKVPIDIKTQLSYNGWEIRMWYVTWHYIVETNKNKHKNK